MGGFLVEYNNMNLKEFLKIDSSKFLLASVFFLIIEIIFNFCRPSYLMPFCAVGSDCGPILIYTCGLISKTMARIFGLSGNNPIYSYQWIFVPILSYLFSCGIISLYRKRS